MPDTPLETQENPPNALTDERRWELEEQERLMGELAQIAHSINNPLTSLLGRAQLLAMRKDLDPKVAKAASVIEESAQRIADHVKQLAHAVRTRRQELVELLGQNDPT